MDMWKMLKIYVTGIAKPPLSCILPNTSVLQAGNKSIQKQEQEKVAITI